MLPVTSGYSLSWEAVVMRQLRRWKRLWRRSLTRSHKRTSMGPSRSCWNCTISALQPEESTSKGTRVSLSIKCPYEKSPETYHMHLVKSYKFHSKQIYLMGRKISRPSFGYCKFISGSHFIRGRFLLRSGQLKSICDSQMTVCWFFSSNYIYSISWKKATLGIQG